MGNLVVKPIAQEVPPEVAHLLSFFEAPQIGSILMELEWSLRKELTTLVQIAESAEKDGDKIKAMKSIRDIQLAGAVGGGHIVSVSHQESFNDKSGLTRQRIVSSQRLSTLAVPVQSARPVIDLAPTPHFTPEIIATQDPNQGSGGSQAPGQHPELGGPASQGPQGPPTGTPPPSTPAS